MGNRFSGVVAVHDEVSNNLVLVEPASGNVISVDSENGGWFKPVHKLAQKLGTGAKSLEFYRMRTDLASNNKLVFYTPNGSNVQLMDLSGDIPVCYKMELPLQIQALFPLNENQYLVASKSASDKEGPVMFLLKKESSDEKMPSVLNPIEQKMADDFLAIQQIDSVSKEGLSDFGLKICLKEAMSSPNTLFTSPNTYATLTVGFPELEFSPNEVYAWPKEDLKPDSVAHNPSRPVALGAKQFIDNGKLFGSS